ncbi:MAG: hypothetical protein MJE77_22165 [Proteobacteria bacterium]|nr:hypothetical protein [Pseudomonadota bacterium]
MTVLAAFSVFFTTGCDDDDGGGFGDDQASTSIQKLTGCFSVRYRLVEDTGREFFFDENIEYMDMAEQGDGYRARNVLVTSPQSAFWNETTMTCSSAETSSRWPTTPGSSPKST